MVAVAVVGVIPPTGGVAAAVLGDGGAGETSRERRGEGKGRRGGENRGEQSRGSINTLDPV